MPDMPINFPTLVASSIHDIKNSLSTVRELISQITANQQNSSSPEFTQLELETVKMNNHLIQLLELYKIDSDKFNLMIDEYSALDILQEIEAQHAPTLQLNNINLTIKCSDDLYCYCDYRHICNALSNIVNNALRYTNTQICISAYKEKQYIVFCVEDDGQGYLEQILSGNSIQTVSPVNTPNNTGLGIHFVATIASLHTAKDDKGFITTDNNSSLGGARFCLFLP
ncbi:MAG: HAMP domain-containing histidine kinase [Methylococcales bacterium]|nr:HAMP domain-containing histidine kinase [Methylococcales bacterium]